MATAVEAMVAEQRAFANNAAHELRTPLTAMRIRTEALLEDDPDEQTRQAYIEEIHAEIERLSRLVDDLRLLSRTEAKNLEISEEEVNLKSLVHALIREFQRPIQEKKLQVEFNTRLELPIIKAGSSHMRVAIRNVLENAIKYTPVDGQITIELDEVYIDERPVHKILVRDSGVGIPAEDLPNLTRRFYRVDKAHNRQVPGSGLGLSLVEAIVSLYDGTLSIVSSGLDQGTEVTILLPKR